MNKNAEAQKKYVDSQAALKRKPRRYYTTDREHVFLTKQLKELRA